MKRIIIILVLYIAFGCEDANKPKEPDNLLPKDKMIAILYDAYILNATKASNRKILERNGIFPETFLYKKHNIDSTQFASSNAYYAYDAEVYKEIITSVKVRIREEKKVYDKALKEENEARKRKQDSINAARKKKRDSLNQTRLKPIKGKPKKKPNT